MIVHFNLHQQAIYCRIASLYRVSIKSFHDYKHLLQENYCTWNINIIFFLNVTEEVLFTTH